MVEDELGVTVEVETWWFSISVLLELDSLNDEDEWELIESLLRFK